MIQGDTIKGRMALSVMMAMMFVVTAFAFVSAMPDVNDNAVPSDGAVLGANFNVVIDGGDTVSAIQTKIQAELTSAGPGDTVTVTGSKTGVTSKLELNIGTGVTLIWKAAYTGTLDYGFTNSEGLITIAGGGTFEAASGGAIDNVNASQSVTVYIVKGNVIVSGGTVKASGASNFYPILVSDGNVTITGGEVSASNNTGYGIRVDTGSVAMAGGKVSASGDNGYGIYAGTGNVTVSGGKVSATGSNGYGIFVNTGNVTMTGGEVSASGIGSGIFIYSTGNITVSGGEIAACTGISATAGNITVTGGSVTAINAGDDAIQIGAGVAAYLTGTVSGALSAPLPVNAVIVEIDVIDVPLSRDGTNEGVTVKEGTLFALSDISWDLSGTQPFLVFDNGTGHVDIIWTVSAGNGGNGGIDGKMMLIIAIIAIAAIAAVLVYVLVIRPKKKK